MSCHGPNLFCIAQEMDHQENVSIHQDYESWGLLENTCVYLCAPANLAKTCAFSYG